jgi:hypothetical protein
VYRFVIDGVVSAIEQAKSAAGDDKVVGFARRDRHASKQSRSAWSMRSACT